MSSFMMKAESIATIADFISTVFNDKNNNTHMAIQGESYTTIEKLQPQNSYIKTVSIKAVYNALSEMNCNALNQRYIHDDKAEPEQFPKDYNHFEVAKKTILTIGNYKDGAFEIPISYYQLLKSIDCYIYQCSEGNVPESALYKAVDDIRAMLANWIIRNTIAYNAANWG